MSRSRLLALGIVVLLLFAGTTSNDFILLDDSEYVVDNPNVSAGLTGRGIQWAVSSIGYFYWQPVTWISHMIDTEVYGLQAGGHHFTNALLHAINAMLVALALFRLTGMAGRSLAAGALFALHPLRVESVAWVAERKDLLAALFFLCGLLAYERYVRKRSMRRYAVILVAYFLALASKPTAVTFPFVLLLLDFWPLQRIRPVWPAVREKLPLLLLALGSSILTFIGQRLAGAMVTQEILPLSARLLNAPLSYVKYLFKFFWPHPLIVYYPMDAAIPLWEVAGAVALLLLITAMLLWKRDRPYLLIGWLWFLGMSVPMIGIVQVGLQAYADRFTYLSMIGLTVAVVWLGADLLPEERRTQVLAGVLVVLALLSWVQIGYWKDSQTLFTHTLEIDPRGYLIHSNLGVHLVRLNRPDEALPHFERAVQLEPRYVEAWANLAVVYSLKKRIDDADRAFQEAVRLWPKSSRIRILLATALMEQDKLDGALREYQTALNLPITREEAAKTHSDIGLILVRQGRTDDAISHFRTALDYQPMLVAAYRNLAGALLEKNQPLEALRQIDLSIALAKNDPELRRIREAIIRSRQR